MLYVIIVFLAKRQQIAKTIHMLEDYTDYGIPEDFEKETKRISYIASFYTGYAVYGGIPFCLYQYFGRKRCLRENAINPKPDLVCGLVSGTWMPFDINYSPRFEIYFIIQSIAAVLLAKTGFTIFCLIFVITEHYVIKLKHLKSMIKRISSTPQISVNKYIKLCVQYHHRILQ